MKGAKTMDGRRKKGASPSSLAVAAAAAVLLLFCRSGVATNLRVALSDSDAGFFVKPDAVYGGEDSDQQQQQSQVVVPVMHPLLLTSVRAEYGDYVATEAVPRSLLRRALGSERFHPSTIVEDMEISAHVVTETISTDRPLLQVLFHGNILPAFRVDARRRNSEMMEMWKNLTVTAGQDTVTGYRAETKYCLVAYVQKDLSSLSSFCVLNGRTSICLAEIHIPPWWWNADQTEYAQVFYSASVLDQNSNCPEMQKTNVTNAEKEDKNFISAVSLTLGQLSYEELKEDQNILVYNPQASFYPGSKFRMPVKLQADSDLQIFSMKVKARHGVRVIGAEARNSSDWKMNLELNHKLHGAMVTAFVTDKKMSSKSDRNTDIFEWIFEVSEDVPGDDRGRINFIVEYEMNVHQKELYRSVENRIVARVEIQRDNVFTIVPVIKTSEIVNMAVLTGKMLTYPMRIYSVTHTGRLNEVTPQATCHSGDAEALKVVESCSWVYLDGTESRGSSSVTVIAKYGRHTKFLFFQVWMPEIPLEVTLSDPLLSHVKGWKVPNQSSNPRRKTRGADFGILTHPGLLLQEEGVRKEDLIASCDVRYQSAVVDVFASFALADMPHNRFLVGRRMMFRVTDLIQGQLHLSNSSVASLGGNIIEGLQPGRTEVQVVSKSGTVIGASELIISSDKVNIEGLQVNIISKLSLSVDLANDIPRALVVRVKKTNQLQHRYREAFLDISIKFDDGTILPLQYVPHGDYHLDLDTLNNHVVAIGQSSTPDVPKVIALGQGKGDLLKVSLMLNEACQRKKSRLLAFSHVYIEADFSKSSNEMLQNDAAQFNLDADRQKAIVVKSGKDMLHLSLNHSEQHKMKYFGQAGDGASMANLDPHKEVHSKHIGDEHGLSSLEVGMYTLLGVFCVAVIVFGINCALFLTVYRHKKGHHDTKDPINCAPDWVWIGRGTLERNAINTACSRALMPEADFNGNHGVQSSGPSSVVVGSNRYSSSNDERNSFASASKGSDCSIPVHGNPVQIPDCNANNLLDDNKTDKNQEQEQSGSSSPTATEAVLTKPQKNCDSSNFELQPHSKPVKEKMTREERFRHLEEAVASGSDVEWEYEALGVTYEELMEYFDNLKESTA